MHFDEYTGTWKKMYKLSNMGFFGTSRRLPGTYYLCKNLKGRDYGYICVMLCFIAIRQPAMNTTI